MKRVCPGAYRDGNGSLHLCPEELCVSVGVPPTDENIAVLTEAAREAAGDMRIPLRTDAKRGKQA